MGAVSQLKQCNSSYQYSLYYTYIYHGSEGIHDIMFVQRCDRFGIITRDIVRDIRKQLGEIGDFEDLVQGKEL